MVIEEPVLPKTTSKASQGTTSFLRTCFNGLNALSGIGIITLPYTLSEAGWMSLTLLFSMAAITFYTSILLKRCMDNEPSAKSYSDVGAAAFGRRGRLLISICMYLELFLVPTGFLIIEGDNLHKLFPEFGFHLRGNFYIGGKPLLTALASLVILPTMWLKDLSLLSFVSAGGVFSAVVITCSTLWAGAFDGVGFGNEGGVLLDLRGIPTALSLYAFSYGVHPMVPSLYTSIKDKSQFTKVCLVMFGLGTLSYTSMAVLGYLMFGHNLSSQITLNLPSNKISSKMAIYTTLLIPISKYALVTTPIVESIERSLPPKCNVRPIRLLVRTLLLLASLTVAISFPYFGILMALVGAVINVSGSVLMPCACFLRMFRSHGLPRVEVGIIVAILVFSMGVAVMGTYTSVKEMVGKF
ncbi:hypothetical protein MLD38_024989 [Melastoma candidum]|uniref:Uncharacterized protein n=1 Tax=Melastoma candidum TaxID=119954 RepID=A0ACB9NVP3_9MYRT|nr:hypothetical protein MLD38_024989 [Melastoma candidum]